MKRKSPRDIPAFARAAMAPKERGTGAPKTEAHNNNPPRAAATPPPPPSRVKPQSTSAKSGQRGQ